MPDPFANIETKIRAFMRHAPDGPGGDETFNALALELFALQRQHNPAYAKLSAGEPKSWREVPAVPTVAFKELEMTSLPPDERQRVFYSSGTTQQDRSRHFHHARSLGLYEASLQNWFFQSCRRFQTARRAFGKFTADPDGMDIFSLIPPVEQALNSSLAYMAESLGREQAPLWKHRYFGFVDPAGVWQLQTQPLLEMLRRYQKESCPVLLFGTAFLFIHLLDAMEEKGVALNLPDGSGLLETGGYKGRAREVSREELRRLMTARLGVPAAQILSEYGMSELSSQAYDRADGVFQFPPWARAVLISPATGQEVGEGERGLIRVFDLANVWSVMAIQTEDIGIKVGDGFSLAGRAPQAEARGCSLMTQS